MLRDGNPVGGGARRRARDSDAVFLGWQETLSGDLLALYTVTAAGHPSFGSTLTDRGLNKLNLNVPQTPLRPSKTQ
jgi:hypothetical protein